MRNRISQVQPWNGHHVDVVFFFFGGGGGGGALRFNRFHARIQSGGGRGSGPPLEFENFT